MVRECTLSMHSSVDILEPTASLDGSVHCVRVAVKVNLYFLYGSNLTLTSLLLYGPGTKLRNCILAG